MTTSEIFSPLFLSSTFKGPIVIDKKAKTKQSKPKQNKKQKPIIGECNRRDCFLSCHLFALLQQWLASVGVLYADQLEFPPHKNCIHML